MGQVRRVAGRRGREKVGFRTSIGPLLRIGISTLFCNRSPVDSRDVADSLSDEAPALP